MKAIIPDIIEVTLFGFDAEDLAGNKIWIYLDCTGCLTDLAESSDNVDTYSLSGGAGYNLYTFPKFTGSTQNSSRYAYKTKIYSKHSSYRRSVERHASLRKHGISAYDANFLGIHLDIGEARTLPALIQVHEKVIANPNASLLTPFNAFDFNVIAQDHKNLLTAIYLNLTPKQAKTMNFLFSDALQGNPLSH